MGEPAAKADLFQINTSVESLVAYTYCPVRNSDTAQPAYIKKGIFPNLFYRFRDPAVPASGNQCV